MAGLAQRLGCLWALPEVGCDGQSLWQLLPAAAGDPAALPAPAGLCCVCVCPVERPDTPVPCTPRVSPSRGCRRGTEVPAPRAWLWGHPFLPVCPSWPSAPPLQPVPPPRCVPQARSWFSAGRAGLGTVLSRSFSECPPLSRRRQQLARQGQPPDSHHVQVPARLQQQQQLGGSAPLHQRQGKAEPSVGEQPRGDGTPFLV